MQARAVVARVVFFITDPAERVRTKPPAWDYAPEVLPGWDLLGQPESGFAFDQRIAR